MCWYTAWLSPTANAAKAEFLRQVEEMARERGVKAFRIDTNYDNRPMLRLLERTGFTPCGKVVYRSGERLAFEKEL